MQKNSNRSGWALTAVVSLVASLFGALPSQAVLGDVDTTTEGKSFAFYADNFAAGAASSSEFVGTLVDDFPMFLQGLGSYSLGSSVVSFHVEKTAGTTMDVLVSTESNLASVTSSAAASATLSKIVSGSTSGTISATAVNGKISLNVKAWSTSDVALSWSPVTLKITAFLDNVRADGLVSRNEPYSVQTVTLLHPNALTRAITIDPIVSGSARVATASATVTGVNLANLSGTFTLKGSVAGGTEFNYNAGRTAAQVATDKGVISGSAAAQAIIGGNTVSAILRYEGVRVGATASYTVVANTATSLKAEIVESDDATSVSPGVADVRPNKTYEVKFTALSGSATVSAQALEVAITSAETFSVASGKTLSVDGGAATTSLPTKYALTTGTDGTVTMKFSTTGVGTGVTFSVAVKSAELSASLDLVTKAATFKLVPAGKQTLYSTTPGTAVALSFDVEDQWGVASDRTNQRVKLTRSGDKGFAWAETISTVAVVAGKADFSFLPAPASATGSTTVTPILETFNADSNVWTEVSGSGVGAAITVNVTSKADAFTGSALASVSASISYDIAKGKYSWSTTVLTVKVENAGAAVAIVAPAGVVIENNLTAKTYSNTVTLRADSSGELKLRFAAGKAGKHTVTYTMGSATTTSLFVVSAAVESAASTVTLPTLDLVPGATTTITGVLADKLGNPIATDTKKLNVSWTGKGLPFNIGNSVTTDEDGKFSFQILVLATETGTGAVTVTYKPTGVAADDISVSKTYTIVAPAAPAAPEVNAVIGTFNGRWAVRVENAKGAVVAVKVGGNWYKYTSLNENYLFSRKSVVGRSVAVAVYVNGTLENVATITIK